MVDADPVAQEALKVLPVGRVERRAVQRGADCFLVGLRRHVDAHQILRLVGRAPLREVDQVDRGAPGLHQLVDRLVQRRLAVLEIQRHGALAPAHDGDLAPGRGAQALGDHAHVAQRRRHQQERRRVERQQRHLPRHPALAIGVVVEFVHHDVSGARGAVAQGHVGEDLGGAADDGRVAVDARVAGQHADLFGAEQPAEIEELLVHQRLDRARVERRPAFDERLEMQRRRDQRLARARRCVQHDVLVGHQLEQRFLLRGIQLEAGRRDVRHETRQDLVGAGAPRGQQRGERGRLRGLVGLVRGSWIW